MEIRRAGSPDLAVLLELAEGYCLADQHPFDAARIAEAFTPLLLDDQHGVVLVVEDDGQVLGYAVVTWGYSIESGGVESLLDEIYVADRNRGLGSALVDACLAAAREHGAHTMFLETEAHNARVRSLYERHGFSSEDSVWMGRRLR